MRPTPPLLGFLTALAGAATLPSACAADRIPWRLDPILAPPDWLSVSGEHRIRYETLDGQFRANRQGSDQALALRTSLVTQFKTEPLEALVELLDARQYLSDDGSPVDTTMVNPLDVLQAHVRWNAGDLIPGGTNTVRIGRETLDLSNRRLVARNAYRNTINAFTGLDWLWQADGGGSVRGFYFLPVNREPEDAASLLDNEFESDQQSFDQQFAGLHGELPPLPWGLRAEAFYYYLFEGNSTALRHRRLHTPGLRVYRPAKPGQWDLEWESDLQYGESHTRTGSGAPDLDHAAHHHHLAVGHTFQHAWKPRVGVRYDFASGDENPNDRENGRFDTLFGARRFEFGPTGIYGAIARANLNSPEYNASIRPWRGVDLSVSHRFVWLAEARDAWTASGLRDASGRSGTEVGHQLEFRLRWDALPGNLRIDTGYVHLFAGEFREKAPNRTADSETDYAWFELTLVF